MPTVYETTMQDFEAFIRRLGEQAAERCRRNLPTGHAKRRTHDEDTDHCRHDRAASEADRRHQLDREG